MPLSYRRGDDPSSGQSRVVGSSTTLAYPRLPVAARLLRRPLIGLTRDSISVDEIRSTVDRH
jgi:hypothetical protein